MSPTLLEIERSIHSLSVDEKLWLLERIVHHLRAEAQRTTSATATDRQQAVKALVKAGLSLPASTVSVTPPPISAERREELARLFSKGRPLSELILEEREGR